MVAGAGATVRMVDLIEDRFWMDDGIHATVTDFLDRDPGRHAPWEFDTVVVSVDRDASSVRIESIFGPDGQGRAEADVVMSIDEYRRQASKWMARDRRTRLRPHEVEVIRMLAGKHLPAAVLDGVIATPSFVGVETTQRGYFLTLGHPALPAVRAVFHEPRVVGQVGDVQCGFVLFLQDGQITLECHSSGDAPLPRDYRWCDIAVRVAP
jgi:hypothetical protein